MAYLRNLRNNRLRQGEQSKEMKGALGSWGRALRRVWYGLICVDASQGKLASPAQRPVKHFRQNMMGTWTGLLAIVKEAKGTDPKYLFFFSLNIFWK